MTDQHPITPPPELFKQWNKAALSPPDPFGYNEYIAIQAARWGADQELEACCEWLDFYAAASEARDLRAARRPKPPSLAKRAMEAQQRVWNNGSTHADWELIRRALERLQELEQN